VATLQYSDTLSDAKLDALEVAIGIAPILNIWSGSEPANCAASRTGTLLATGTLPSDWLANAATHAKAKSGTWTLTGQSGAGSGTNAGYFEITDSGAVATYIQGKITATGGGGDLTMDNISIANLQSITVNSFVITAGNQ
jgi:hypothetical protein